MSDESIHSILRAWMKEHPGELWTAHESRVRAEMTRRVKALERRYFASNPVKLGRRCPFGRSVAYAELQERIASKKSA
jgi:hypothetical protein